VLIWTGIATLGLIAVTLGAISNFSCYTVTIPQFQQVGGSGFRRGGSLDTGPFSYRSNQIIFQAFNSSAGNTSSYAFDICRPYSLFESSGYEWDQDSLTLAIRGFASIAITLGTIGLGGVLMVPCCGTTNCRWNCYGLLFVLTGIFQGLCLTITRSTLCTDNPILQILADKSSTRPFRDNFADSCEVYIGYNCGIAATTLWLIAGLCILIVPAPEKWEDDWCSGPTSDEDADEEAKTITPVPDYAIER
jgi:hypothetical protein